MFPLLIAKYWKLAIALALVLAVAVQTHRLHTAKAAIALQAASQAQFEANLAVERAEGVAEGAKRRQAALEALQAAQAKVEAARRASLERRAAAAEARAKRLEALLAGAQWDCLDEPLPEGVLDEYRQ
jgi:hypothetical protein